MPDVYAELVGQPTAVAMLRAAVQASHNDGDVPAAAMTHSWLFTGPPGSGRSVAARAFAAALQCADRGCGSCTDCRTVLHGTHADVRSFSPEGLSISVREMRAVVQTASRKPLTGRYQIVLIEDADRLTEGAANALLKAVEEPAPQTIFLLCAPSTHPDDVPVTIRSRCRGVSFGSPTVAAIAEVLRERDGIPAARAEWAAAVCGGHVGRARRLARDAEAAEVRTAVLSIPGRLRQLADVYDAAQTLLDRAKSEARNLSEQRDAVEVDELRTALGAGGTGRGAAAAVRGTVGVIRDLERRQRSRATRTERDVIDRALVDLSGFYRDVLAVAVGAPAALVNPDLQAAITTEAERIGASGALCRLDVVLDCRQAIEANVKPQIAVEALMMRLLTG